MPKSILDLPTRNICGENIARRCKLMNLSLPDFVARLNALGWPVDRSTICKIENGYRRVEDYEIPFFCAVLGVTADFLLGIEECD